MDENTIGEHAKRNRNCQCPTCQEWFTSRKSRHTHQMQSHRAQMKRHPPVVVKKRLVPASELY